MKLLDVKTNILLGLFVTSLLLANLLGNKITTLFGIRVSVGIFVFPLLFLITDVVEEVHGKKMAKLFLYVSLLCLLFALAYTAFSIWIWHHPAWELQGAYSQVLGTSIRMMVASFVAFAISQSHDLWAFDFWKRKTKGKYLWLRNNLSTMVSQLIDTTVFMFVAFYHVSPKFTVPFVISLIIPYWLLKVTFAALDTPFVYLGCWWLRGKRKAE